jgi:hypothetical protein
VLDPSRTASSRPPTMMRQLDHSALLPTRRSMKHCTASARVRLLAVPLVQPHPPPSLHKRRLCRCVRSLQAVPQCSVLRVCEPVVGICL